MENDKVFVGRLLARDERAFRELCFFYGRMMIAAAWRITGCRSLAEDAWQTALERLLVSLVTWDGRGTFGSWLYRLTQIEALQILRKRRAARLVLDDGDGEHRENLLAAPPDVAANLEQFWGIVADLLPARQLKIVVLFYVEGLSDAEIAAGLGLAVSTVTPQRSRAVKRLREELPARLAA
jgi:RNA polymerase sigma-70 factor (ECF subfamily)